VCRFATEALLSARSIQALVHANVPILNWSVANAVAVTDPAGSRKIDKEKARLRVDGCVALAMAMGLRARDRGSAHAIDVRALIG
jgi:phage terminase large subunit-like protein